MSESREWSDEEWQLDQAVMDAEEIRPSGQVARLRAIREEWPKLHATVAALTAENERLRENEHTLRMGWWLSHGCSGLYGDDGEMHCGQCMIDFKRDDPRDIETRIKNANMLKLSRAALPSSRETTDG